MVYGDVYISACRIMSLIKLVFVTDFYHAHKQLAITNDHFRRNADCVTNDFIAGFPIHVSNIYVCIRTWPIANRR